MQRRWSINGRFLTQPTTGVQRYAREIVKALDQLSASGNPLACDVEFRLLVPRGAICDMPLSRIRLHEVGSAGGHAWEQFHLPAAARGGLLSLCNTGPIAAPRQIVCIHDLNTRIVPQSYSRAFRLTYRALLPILGRCASRIATVSQFSAGQIANCSIARPSKISIIPNGHEHVRSWQPRHSAATRSAAGPDTIVVIGSSAPHKNIRLLVDMAESLGDRGFRLAIVGMANSRVFADAGTKADNRGNRVAWLGRVSDSELAALLSDSFCLAVPSLTEGFGLPALEAMALGCPVVASDRGSLPEVCAGGSLFAPPDEPSIWLDQFLKLRGEPGLRERLAAGGAKRARDYSWRASGEGYLRLMAEIDGIDEIGDTPLATPPEAQQVT